MSVRRSLSLVAVALLIVGCEQQAAPSPTPPSASAAAAVVAPMCDLSVGPREVVVSAARRRELGLDYWPDMTLAVDRHGDAYTFYAQNGGDTRIIARSTGTLDDPVQSVIPRIGVQQEKIPDSYNGMAAVYRDSMTDTLIGFSYTERQFSSGYGFYSGTGILKSTDDGKTWTDLGPIIQDADAYDPAAPHIGGQYGLPLIVGDYFNLYFVGMGVARARVDDVIRAAVDRDALVPWMKYFNGAWTEPAIGGRFTALEMKGSAWTAYRASIQPVSNVAVYGGSYNEHLKKYLLIIGQWPMTKLGNDSADLHLLESSDGLVWENELEIEHGGWAAMYGTVVGMGKDPHVSGSDFYIYYTYYPNNGWWVDAQLARRLVSCKPTARESTALTLGVRADPVKLAQNATISLKNATGTPVVGANVEVSWTPNGGLGVTEEHALSGVVPVGARTALVQLHYNQHVTGVFTAPIDVTVYDARYGESSAPPRTIPNGDFARGLTGWSGTTRTNASVATDAAGRRGLQVKAAQSESGFLNSATFPVTAGAPYQFAVTARVAAASQNAGGFTIMFFDGRGDPQGGWTLVFSGTHVVPGVSDADGNVSVKDLPTTGFDIRARYEGDTTHRPAAPAFRRD